MDDPSPDPRCAATVYKRDTLRVSLDGKRQFRMHYNRCRCRRPAGKGLFCVQHAAMAAAGRAVRQFDGER